MYTERSCRVCSGPLDTILDLGHLHPSGFLRPEEEPLPKVPHDLCVCGHCRLVQLRHTMEPDLMFRQYWYLSGINETMREELADIAAQVQRRVGLQPSDYIIDIGANDGTLLAAYPPCVKIGFEPAHNLRETLAQHASIVVPDYFPAGLEPVAHLVGAVKAIHAIACFYDLDDPLTFLSAVARLLHPDGVFVLQFQDWHQMQQATAFDNICTEHLFYPSLAAVERMATRVGLRVVDAEIRSINGGSYRLYLMHAETHRVPSPNVSALEHLEHGCEDWETFDQFGWRCLQARGQIQAFIETIPGTIDLYGASTKGNTLLQWVGLDKSRIRQSWERSPAKFGLRTPGTNIPIVNETIGRMDPPDALLAVIWQFRESILRREAAYLDNGGQLLFPLPRVDMVRADYV